MDLFALGSYPVFTNLTWNFYHIPSYVFSMSNLKINTTIYGTDFDVKCILGFFRYEGILSNRPTFLFDLDPLRGVINGFDNSNAGFFDSLVLCFKDTSLVCPPSHPFTKPNNTLCFDCSNGIFIAGSNFL